MISRNMVIYQNVAIFSKQISPKTGTILHIRPICAQDEASLRIFFETLSEETVFYRFGNRRFNMSRAHLAELCRVDHYHDFAFLAVLPGDPERIVGEVRLNRLADDETAEISFVVADQWQGKGIGKQLMEFCLGCAKEVGLKTLVMEVMRSNLPMMYLGHKYDFQRLPGNKEDDMETLALKINRECGILDPMLPYMPTKKSYDQHVQGYCG